MKTRYIFLLNPAAGQGKAVGLEDELRQLSDKIGVEIDIYFTKEELDAEIMARGFAKEMSDDGKLRIYACGGDGTLNEIVNGVMGYENVEVGIIPTGTGNDFIRNFGDESEFLNLENQIFGDAQKVDVIGYEIFNDGYSSKRYCINMINIGFDSHVVHMGSKLKTIPGISGGFAYTLGIFASLIKKHTASVRIDMDGEMIFCGNALLTAVGNGSFCGGGIKALPMASATDGLVDVGIVNECSRSRIVKLLPKYKKGTHMETDEGRDLVMSLQTEKLRIEGLGEKMLIGIDGELFRGEKIDLKIAPRGINFIAPKTKILK